MSLPLFLATPVIGLVQTDVLAQFNSVPYPFALSRVEGLLIYYWNHLL